jgi:hypothetical protein
MRFLKVILVVLGVVTVGFFVTGIATPKEFHAQLSVSLPASKIRVWNMLTDIKHLPERRKDVTKIEMLGLNSKENPYWKEYAGKDQFMVFEMANQEYPNRMVINMTESTFGMTGSWTYQLDGNDSITNLTVTEDSKIQSYITRSILTMTSRAHFLKREVISIKKTIAEGK